MTHDQSSSDLVADRRHTIELAVQMRPDMELDELRQVMTKLGFVVDDATLEGDLDALGYDVVVEDVEIEPGEEVDTAPAGAVDTADAGLEIDATDGTADTDTDAEPDAATVVDDVDEATDDDEALAALSAASLATDADIEGDGPSDDDLPVPEASDAEVDPAPVAARDADPDYEATAPDAVDEAKVGTVAAADADPSPDRSVDRVTRIVAAVAVVAAIVCVASLVWLFVDRGSDDAAVEDPPVTTAETGSSASTETTEATTTVADEPLVLPPLTDPVEDMDFSEPSELLPTTVDGDSWLPLAGDFAVADGVAVSDPGVQASAATIATPAGNVRAEVTLPEPSDKAGIAFAARDDRSYRAWVIDTAASTATLYLVEGTGREVEVAPVEVSLAPGVVLGISIEGDTTNLLVDGVVVGSAPTRDGTGVGLAALAPLTAATFDDFRVAHG